VPEEAFDWQEDDDLTSLSEGRLRELLSELAEEEPAVSYRRRLLRGRIGLIRTDLVRRDGAVLPPEEPVLVLVGEPSATEAGGPGDPECRGSS